MKIGFIYGQRVKLMYTFNINPLMLIPFCHIYIYSIANLCAALQLLCAL